MPDLIDVHAALDRAELFAQRLGQLALGRAGGSELFPGTAQHTGQAAVKDRVARLDRKPADQRRIDPALQLGRERLAERLLDRGSDRALDAHIVALRRFFGKADAHRRSALGGKAFQLAARGAIVADKGVDLTLHQRASGRGISLAGKQRPGGAGNAPGRGRADTSSLVSAQKSLFFIQFRHELAGSLGVLFTRKAAVFRGCGLCRRENLAAGALALRLVVRDAVEKGLGVLLRLVGMRKRLLDRIAMIPVTFEHDLPADNKQCGSEDRKIDQSV